MKGTNPASGLSYYQEQWRTASPDEDMALAARSRTGDVDAFEQLVAKHQKRMLNIAYRMINDYDDACEVVQDAFVAAWKNIAAFRGEAKFTTWMTSITLNHARNRLKQIAAHAKTIAGSLDDPIATEEGQLKFEPASSGPSVLDKLESQDIRDRVRKCIDALEPEFREVIILRDLQDFTYEEIAVAVKAREGTIKSRLFRAREAVKECLKKALEML